MPKPSRMHHADEFGKRPSQVMAEASAMSRYGRRSVGTPTPVILDAMAEKESVETPPPPPFSMKALVIGLAIMFVAGVIAVLLIIQFSPVPLHR